MIEKPKKERRFLKALGRVGEILLQEVLIKVGSSLIKRIGGKKQIPSILFLFLSISLYGQFPININKQRLGFQTTADGLVWRGSLSDTASIQPVSNQYAWVILDTVNLKLYSFDFTSNVWGLVGGGLAAFTQPIDSLFFKTSVSPNNVDTAKMRWDSELGTVVLGMYDQVPNELGFKNFWLVKNQTGSTITKNSLVYASGTVGASGRILVSKFIANGTIDAKYLLGITAHDLSNGEDGYVISFGKIRQVNTDTFAAGAILYPSPTTAGVWTDVEPVAPNIDLPIGFCINSSSNNGTISIRVASGYSLNELHNVAITSPVEKSSLFYSDGLWRDTTAALLVSDTASMLTPYFRDADTTSLNLVSRFAAKLNISDTSSMLTNYLRSGVAASTYLPLTGGTVSGLIRRQDNNYNENPNTFYFNILNYQARVNNTATNIPSSQITFTDRPGTFGFPNAVRTSDIYLMTAHNWDGSNYSVYPDTTLSIVSNQDGGRIGISKLNPAYKLDVNGTFNASGNSLIGGTLGVTGATTLSSTISATTGTFTGLNVTNASTEGILTLQGADNNTPTRIQFKTGDIVRQEIVKPIHKSNLQFRSYPTGTAFGGYEFYVSNGSTESLAATIGTDKSLSLTGTLGVTGATTLSSTLSGTTGTFKALTINNNVSSGQGVLSILSNTFNDANKIQFGDVSGIRREILLPTGVSNLQFRTYALGGTEGGYSFYTRRNPNAEQLAFNIDFDGNSNFYGTLGVTGATTLTGALTVNNATVLNEGSGDFDTRIESDGNANMVFVDASTDRVGIGTGTPSKTLDVNGEVKIATVTATPTALLGKDGSNVVGEVTDINQSGVMKVGSTTENTSSVGIINVPHGLSYTPTKVIATIAQQSSYVIVCHGITSTNLNFTIYDSTDGTALDNVSVGFFWIAFK
jgi:hypothetical protein